jgi:hypothetical protein
MVNLVVATSCSDKTAIDLGSLTSLDLRPLSRVESVGGGFLVGCDGLEISRVERGESLVLQWVDEVLGA